MRRRLAPAVLAASGGGWLLVRTLEGLGLSLRIGPVTGLRLSLLLPPVFWTALALWGDGLLARHTKGAVRWAAGLAAAAVELALVPVLLLQLAAGLDAPRYFTLRSPEDRRTVIVEEESRLLYGGGRFYAPVCPGLMRRLDADYQTDDGFRPFSAGAYTLTWEPDQLVVDYAFGQGGIRRTCAVPLT